MGREGHLGVVEVVMVVVVGWGGGGGVSQVSVFVV